MNYVDASPSRFLTPIHSVAVHCITFISARYMGSKIVRISVLFESAIDFRHRLKFLDDGIGRRTLGIRYQLVLTVVFDNFWIITQDPVPRTGSQRLINIEKKVLGVFVVKSRFALRIVLKKYQKMWSRAKPGFQNLPQTIKMNMSVLSSSSFRFRLRPNGLLIQTTKDLQQLFLGHFIACHHAKTCNITIIGQNKNLDWRPNSTRWIPRKIWVKLTIGTLPLPQGLH